LREGGEMARRRRSIAIERKNSGRDKETIELRKKFEQTNLAESILVLEREKDDGWDRGGESPKRKYGGRDRVMSRETRYNNFGGWWMIRVVSGERQEWVWLI
jgi:hypothetical protein